jgi:hypothetical protein
MGGSDTDVKPVTPIDVNPIDIGIKGCYGQLWITPNRIAPNKNAPLLVVFGGIPDESGRKSGVYMWDYMKNIKNRFHIFVASDSKVIGHLAYSALKDELNQQGLAPSRQILYLFSGGWRPGKDLLTGGDTTVTPTFSMTTQFSSIYLVDIWMGNNTVKTFYTNLAKGYTEKITYVYTSGGSTDPAARDALVGILNPKVGAQKAFLCPGDHMGTNIKAISILQ